MAHTIRLEDRLTSGYRLSHPSQGDEVVVTGISGYFPNSDSVMELKDHLFNKVDLVSADESRWKLIHHGMPLRTGKINNINRFDASFFGVHYREAHTMDPMNRLLLEKTYEAIIDAGVNPKELRNTKTGVFIAVCVSESEKKLLYEKIQVNDFGIAGCSHAMLANRISHWLGVTGPSYTLDSACSSSLYAVDCAFRAIRDGYCDAAIVGGACLCLHPYLTLQFAGLRVLSPEGISRSFDNDANGYVRSEAVVACFLQKAKDSRRVYAQMVYTKTNSDGYKEHGITYPSSHSQEQLLRDFYEECLVQPTSLEFVEAHGTATRVGDPQEMFAIDNVLCAGRTEPLLIGSIKSNLGHTEPAAGLSSIVKLCIAYSTGYIPPNIHYKTPRKGVAALVEGRLKVVTEKHPWNKGLSCVNSFGFGGSNAHSLFKNFSRDKINNGMPLDDLPRLVCVSGRTKTAVAKILDDLESRTVDVEEVRLWHAIHDKSIDSHDVRGFTLLKSTPVKSVSIAQDIQYFSDIRRPVWFRYSGVGCQWPGMARELMRIPVFAAAIEKCHKILECKGVNLIQIITSDSSKIYDDILNSILSIAAVQIGLTDVLKAVGIDADHIIGYNIGELGCAYADGCLTAEQIILFAFDIGLASCDVPLINKSTTRYLVALGYEEIKILCPPEVEIAFNNNANSSIIYGPVDVIKSFVAKLNAQGNFTEEIPYANNGYHSRSIADSASSLLKCLKEIIPNSKSRSARWISTSDTEMQWQQENAELASADCYYTNNFINPTFFEETSRLIHQNALVVDVIPHDFLQDIISGSLNGNILNISLIKKLHEDNVQALFTSLGKLYVTGLNLHLSNIYPDVPFPVSRGTPMLSHLVKWEHSEDWYVASFKEEEKMESRERIVKISIRDEDCVYMIGRNLYPATGYLVLIWETLSMIMGKHFTEISVVFQNIQFHRPTNIPKDGKMELTIVIQEGNGDFEIAEGRTPIVTGRIYSKLNVGKDYHLLPSVPEAIGPNVKHMLAKDFYKELRLRGYHYSSNFHGVLGCTVEGTRGRIAWTNNWVAFLDCMLQLQIIGYDTRDFIVPSRIEMLSIDAKIHKDAISKMNPDFKEQSFEVRVYPNLGVIRAGGVEIRGLNTVLLPKKIPHDEPILEKFEFVPNFVKANKKIEYCLRIYLQLIFENIQMYKVKAVELVDEEYKKNNFKPIIEKVADIVRDTPLMQAELLLISKEPIEISSNIVQNKSMSNKSNAVIFIGANLLKRLDVLQQATSTLQDKSFIISRENVRPNIKDYEQEYNFIAIYETHKECLVIFRKRVSSKPARFVKIVTADQTYSWINEVKKWLKKGQKIVLYSQHEQIYGLLGLINCLRRDPGGENVYSLMITDPSAPEFNLDLEMYRNQLDKDLVMNVFCNGQWGTYRHLPLEDLEEVPTVHAYVNTRTVANLSSIRWLEGPLRENHVFENHDDVLIHVYFSTLNFLDMMIATGRIKMDTVTHDRLEPEYMHGFEVVGRSPQGCRVMAMVRNSGVTNMAQGDRSLMWCIPDEWSFEEAATVPVAYATVYYAMVMIGKVKQGETILIHSGCGGVGQAAINVALHYGCVVFTTVGTAEKRAFIKKLFPQLKDNHIGNSRDTSFEHMINKETKGKGVDLVLNSLSDEKLQASLRCLGYRGRFLEIGKSNISYNSPIGMYKFSNEVSFHAIELNAFTQSKEFRKKLQELLLCGMQGGAVRPLTFCTFERHEIQTAFRYMAAGKHIGKVVIKIRDEEHRNGRVIPAAFPITAVPRYICHADNVYIVVGGLGGFGLELVDWLIKRGARKLLLTSRKGVTNGYQSSRLRTWSSYGVNILISTHDVTTESGCDEMLNMAKTFGYIQAIFNLAVVLKDSVFLNQTPETFRISFAPKALTTMHLDKLSRQLCPGLKDFVVFSSVCCGRGNAGQTNYGFSSSVAERICELRKKHGFPALAVQWGAIGDVGILVDAQKEIVDVEVEGTTQQKISSCLLTLEKFMKQHAPVVSSIVLAKKSTGAFDVGNFVDAIAQIMGIRDLKTVSQQVTLAELGMDSMIAVEIKNTLERDFETFLTAHDIRNLTFARLVELTAQREAVLSTSASCTAAVEIVESLRILMTNFGDEKLASEPYIFMRTMTSKEEMKEKSIQHTENIIFMLPGLEGCADTLESLCRRLNAKVCVLQFGIEHKNEDLDMMVNRLYQTLLRLLPTNAPFMLLGYNFGCQLVLELAAKLENEGRQGVVFCLDGAPNFIYKMLNKNTSFLNDTHLQNSVLGQIVDIVAPNNNVTKILMEKLNDIDSYDERIKCALRMTPVQSKYSNEFITAMAAVIFDRLKMILKFNPNNIKKLRSPIILLRPKEDPPLIVCEENYGLDQFTNNTVTVHYLEGNHVSIINNKDCANVINKLLDAGEYEQRHQ